MKDSAIAAAAAQIGATTTAPTVTTFFDDTTCTATHVVHDPATRAVAVIDSVLDYDAAAGGISYRSAEKVVEYVREHQLQVQWQLETHAHADHLSAAPWLQQQLGGELAIGRHIIDVQQVFGKIFNAGTEFERDGSQFDRLFDDGERFQLGSIDAIALHVPGHTPADMAYVIGNIAFIGDTLFMPDFGTARADFPGGDAQRLFRSIRRLLSLPSDTALYLCHDYQAPGRDQYAWQTTVAEQREHNVHVREGVNEHDFVQLRTQRDATLNMPTLILPSVQVNMRGGRFPEPESDGERYLKIPINRLK
ncbi:MBL fold metallo-hydrolase [Carnimonas bestiolae]|uniref:MBL fold metallo-hydrolase n=1 Tax=Carnimonas bestiolae TaxID=3402172 RepID=UPI003EDBD36F